MPTATKQMRTCHPRIQPKNLCTSFRCTCAGTRAPPAFAQLPASSSAPRAFLRLYARAHCSSSRSSTNRERVAHGIRPLAPHPHHTIFAGGNKATTGETRVIVDPYCAAFVRCVGAGSRCALPEGGVPCHQSRGGQWTHRDIGMRLSI